MKRISEHLREHLLMALGVGPPVQPLPPLVVLQQTEWSAEFERYMRNRLIVGAFRYGRFGSAEKGRYDCLGAIRRRCDLYRATGNQETLVDIANLAMVEFTEGCHPKRHWAPSDDGEHAERTK